MKQAVAEDAVPVIIAGAPRSGTTLLTAAMNAHPEVLITNELRAWVMINELRKRTKTPSESLPKHPLRDDFRHALFKNLTQFYREFYEHRVTRDQLGCPANTPDDPSIVIRAFGDKNPGYADPNSKDLLIYIATQMPETRFIHIHRDPRSCIASYLRKDVYPDEVSRCIDIWRYHTQAMIDLEDRLGSEQVLKFSYEDFVSEKARDIQKALESHLILSESQDFYAFMDKQREKPTPFRSPATVPDHLGKTVFEDTLKADQIAQIEDGCAALMERLGYQ